LRAQISALCADVPWLAVYQAEGRKALAGYLGTPSEQDFDELGQTLARFKNGIDAIWLKRMGRDDAALWYDKVDFSQVKVLIVEWTHGNSDFYCGVDLPVFLYSTPQETMTYPGTQPAKVHQRTKWDLHPAVRFARCAVAATHPGSAVPHLSGRACLPDGKSAAARHRSAPKTLWAALTPCGQKKPPPAQNFCRRHKRKKRP